MPRPSLLLVLVLSALGCSAGAPDTILVGKVWTGDPDRPWGQAVAIQGDSIVQVGDSLGILALAGQGTELVRVGSGLIVPGFQDNHTHFVQGGFQLASVDLRDADTPEEFTRRIAAHARTLAPGEWILGGDWDHERWPSAPLPRRDWIDSVTPDNPVFISRLDGHMALANSAALAAAGITAATGEVAGGTIVRGPGGAPAGVLKDGAMGLVSRVIPEPSAAQLDTALTRGMAHAASLGITGVTLVSATWPEVAALRRAEAAGTLTLRISANPWFSDWRTVADSLPVLGAGSRWLRVAGVKGMVDGSLGSTTAWFYEPYLDEPGTTGLTVTPVDSVAAWVGAADSAGLQVIVHAIGDRANDVLLAIFDSVAQAHGPRDRRFRIEHAQHLSRAGIARFAALGVIPSMQPYHAIDDGRWAAKRIGPERIKTTYAFRSLLDAGARLSFGSDWTVAPLDPLLGIDAAVSRRTIDGRNPGGWVPEERITVEEALRAYTVANAYGVFGEGWTGMLKPGYQADLVVIDRDITTLPAEEIRSARVLRTLIGGRTVFQR